MESEGLTKSAYFEKRSFCNPKDFRGSTARLDKSDLRDGLFTGAARTCSNTLCIAKVRNKTRGQNSRKAPKANRAVLPPNERGVTHGSDRPVSKNTRDLYGNETAGGRSGQGRNLQGLRRRTEGVRTTAC